jgi:hypothetical protein
MVLGRIHAGGTSVATVGADAMSPTIGGRSCGSSGDGRSHGGGRVHRSRNGTW